MFKRIKDSCATAAAASTAIQIDEIAVRRFVEAHPPAELEQAEPVVFPLKFSSEMEKVNFLAISAMLEFGSGFRRLLHQHCGRGAHDTIAYGLISTFLQNSGRLDAQWMRSIQPSDVSELFGIPSDEEKAVMPGVYMAEVGSGPLYPLILLIVECLNSAGQGLDEAGYGDMAALVFDVVGVGVGSAGTAAALVEKLCSVIPAFNDVSGDVVFHKKAQLLCADLYLQLGLGRGGGGQSGANPCFCFSDIRELSIFPDNVIPAVLAKEGILVLSAELRKQVDEQVHLPHNSAAEVELRACSVAACEAILREYRVHDDANVMAINLDFFLWRLGKADGYRSLERHCTRDTMMY